MATVSLSTGAFARLCGVRKGTLRFYDQEGLLPPRQVSGSGYRRYDVDQYFDFELIRLLKDTGCSLAEIKTYLYRMDGTEFLALLKEKRAIVQQERERLRQSELMLQDLMEGLTEALAFRYDELRIQDLPEERLDVWPVRSGMDSGVMEQAKEWKAYEEYVASLKEKPRKPFGVILNLDDAMQGKAKELFRFSRALRTTPKARLHIRPAGRFATMGHKGDMVSQYKALAAMLRRIAAEGLRPVGDVYVYDMVLCGKEGDAAYFAQEFRVQVREEPKG